jgi:hypothetical protein
MSTLVLLRLRSRRYAPASRATRRRHRCPENPQPHLAVDAADGHGHLHVHLVEDLPMCRIPTLVPDQLRACG